MERALWSGGLVLVWVVSLTMLTWEEFMVVGPVAFGCWGPAAFSPLGVLRRL